LLKQFPQLAALEVSCGGLTDAGLKHLGELKQFKSLKLSYTLVTDAGLKELKELKLLESLNLVRTKVMAAGVKDLKEAFPKCGIAHERRARAALCTRRLDHPAAGVGERLPMAARQFTSASRGAVTLLPGALGAAASSLTVPSASCSGDSAGLRSLRTSASCLIAAR